MWGTGRERKEGERETCSTTDLTDLFSFSDLKIFKSFSKKMQYGLSKVMMPSPEYVVWKKAAGKGLCFRVVLGFEPSSRVGGERLLLWLRVHPALPH